MSHRITSGAAVRALRRAHGIRQAVLAERCDITRPFLANVEAGRKQPSLDTTLRIAHELGVPVDAITYPACDHDTAGVA